MCTESKVEHRQSGQWVIGWTWSKAAPRPWMLASHWRYTGSSGRYWWRSERSETSVWRLLNVYWWCGSHLKSGCCLSSSRSGADFALKLSTQHARYVIRPRECWRTDLDVCGRTAPRSLILWGSGWIPWAPHTFLKDAILLLLMKHFAELNMSPSHCAASNRSWNFQSCSCSVAPYTAILSAIFTAPLRSSVYNPSRAGKCPG